MEMTDVFERWIDSLKDRAGRARIQVRIDRLSHGNPGQHRTLREGVSELKITSARDTAFTTRSAARN